MTRVSLVGRTAWSAADAPVGLSPFNANSEETGKAGPEGPARTRGSAPRILCFVLLAVATLTGCRDSAGPAASIPRISISCDHGECKPTPDHLASWPKQIVVVSPEIWECHTVLPVDAQAPVIELRSRQNPDRIVRLAVIDQGSKPGVVLPVLSLTVALLALMMAGWVAYLAWDCISTQRQRVMASDVSIRDMDRTLRTVADSLVFPVATEPRGPEPRMPTTPEPAALPREVEALKTEVAQFIQYVKDCFVGIGRASEAIQSKIRELEKLSSQIGRQTDAAACRAQYRALAKTLSRLALRATDDDFSHHGKRNPAAETALGSLLNVTGFKLLSPKPLEKFSDGRHTASPRTERAEAKNQHGYVARVERRGLLDSNNEVIEKAEVVLYDYRSY